MAHVDSCIVILPLKDCLTLNKTMPCRHSSYIQSSILSNRATTRLRAVSLSSKIRGKEHKSKLANVTVSVTWEGNATLLAARGIVAPTSRSQSCSHAYLFLHSFPRAFEEKRECSQSMLQPMYQFRPKLASKNKYFISTQPNYFIKITILAFL